MRPDVLIAGGGPAGCALSIALAQRGIRSTIVEKGDRARARPGEMLQPAARELLADVAPRGHIVNLGHGILPQTPLASVDALVDVVHSEKL